MGHLIPVDQNRVVSLPRRNILQRNLTPMHGIKRLHHDHRRFTADVHEETRSNQLYGFSQVDENLVIESTEDLH